MFVKGRVGWSTVLIVFGLLATVARGGDVDRLVADLAGKDEPARSLARQYLPREGSAIVPKVVPLLRSDDAAVWNAASNVLADLANEVAIPGREADRAVLASAVLGLLAPGEPAAVKLRALRLIPVVVGPGHDVALAAALLDDAELHEKARVALAEAGTPEARAALRDRLRTAKPDAVAAYLDALAQLRDAETVSIAAGLTRSDQPQVRAAALRALAWTGDPAHLEAAKAVVASADAAHRSDVADGLIRLLAAMSRDAAQQSAARAAYLELLATGQGVERDAALAGLGRIGDATTVAPVLAAIGANEPPTRLVGLAALRAMPGPEVTKVLVEVFPAQPVERKAELLGVFAGRRDAAALPLLTQAASDPALRATALRALGEIALPEAVDPLVAAVQAGQGPDREAAQASLEALAQSLRGSRPDVAGYAYSVLFDTTAPDAKDLRRRAVEGLTACPVPQGLGAARAVATDPGLATSPNALLMGVAGALTAADRKAEAIELYEVVKTSNPPAALIPELVKGLTAAGAEADARGLLGAVTRWWVVGPFDLGDNNEGWNSTLVDEPNVNVVGRYMSGKSRVQWKPVESTDPNGKIDLLANVSKREKVVGYAYAEIQVDSPIDATLLLGSDDGAKIWVNGAPAFDLFTSRGLTIDQDRVPVKLQVGTNKLLLKVHQNVLGWEFCVRLVDAEGRPIAFTQKAE